MKFQGKVENWNDQKGYGFVEPNGGGKRTFVHINAFKNRHRRPIDGDIIVYTLVAEGDDKFKAEEIKFARDSVRTRPKSKSKSAIAFTEKLTLVFFIGLLALVVVGSLPVIVIGLYSAISLVTFFAYASDKKAARNRGWRISQKKLHTLALFGGWPGALMAQNRLRHKSIKKEFKLVYRATILANLAGLLWIYSEQGNSIMPSLLSRF